MSQALKGSIPPVITPFSNNEIDLASYKKLIEFHIEEGSHGILVNGTSAEPSTLTVKERNQLVDVAIVTANKSVPIVAATGSQSLLETKALTDHAVAAGADALLIVTPYYIKPPQRGIIEYYIEVTKDVDIPWMIYHIPGRAAVSITLETIKELKERSPNFAGMKHAVNDLGFVSRCLATFPDFKIFVGLEELSFPELAIGAANGSNLSLDSFKLDKHPRTGKKFRKIKIVDIKKDAGKKIKDPYGDWHVIPDKADIKINTMRVRHIKCIEIK